MKTRLLRVTEAAQMAGIGRTMAYEFAMSGAWPSVKIGRALRIPLTGLEEWIEAREEEARIRAAELRGDTEFRQEGGERK